MTLSWVSIVRLGLIQMALGAIVVLTTSTLNRLMIVELALPAVLPGLLVALHYGVQITRPNWGFVSDAGGNRTKWIILGMLALALGALMAAFGVVVLETQFGLGLLISIIAYILIGLGVGASGTSLLALLATYTAERRRAAAATITWLMMIAGIAITAGVVGSVLDPYSASRLMVIVAIVTGGAFLMTCLAIFGIERRLPKAPPPKKHQPFMDGIREIWGETQARNFTIFVFLSMTAYFMQELILEPYAGLAFQFTPGESTALSGAQNGGVFVGMLTVGILATGLKIGALRNWVIFGCLSSAGALLIIASLGTQGAGHLLVPATVYLGFSNGVFAVAAIGTMMGQAGEGREQREGTRMGLWGAAQAIAAGFGGLTGAALVDILRGATGSVETSFGLVFGFEALIFITAAYMAYKILGDAPQEMPAQPVIAGE